MDCFSQGLSVSHSHRSSKAMHEGPSQGSDFSTSLPTLVIPFFSPQPSCWVRSVWPPF